MKATLFKSKIVAALALSVMALGYAQTSLADFGNYGTTILTAGTGLNEQPAGLIMQPDGKFVVAGWYYNGSTNTWVMWRCNNDGSLDSTFGTNGRVIISFGGSYSWLYSLVLQTDGKLVLGGGTTNARRNFAVLRFNSDGSPDLTFGSSGRVATDFGKDTVITAMVLQSDAKLAAVGSYWDGTKQNISLARYNSNGNLDTTFGNNGTTLTAFRNGNDYIYSIVQQTDNKLVIGGMSIDGVSGSDLAMALARFNSNGILDTTFGSGGKVITQAGTGITNSSVQSLVLQTDGKLMAAGNAAISSSTGGFALVRYNTDGSLDTGFGTGGISKTNVGSRLNALVLQFINQFVAAGYSQMASPTRYYFTLVRYNSNGSLDTSFGNNNGIQLDHEYIGTSGFSLINNIVVQTSDNKLVVAGTVYNGSDMDVALARYNSNGLPDSLPTLTMTPTCTPTPTCTSSPVPTVTPIPPVLGNVYPRYALVSGNFQLNARGKWFTGITGVQLKNSNTSLAGTGLNISDSNNLSAQFSFPTVTGLFDLILSKAANSFIFKTVFTFLSPLAAPVQWQVADLGRAGNPASPGRSSIAIGDGDHDGQAEVYVADNEDTLAKFKYQNNAGWSVGYLPESLGNYFNSLVIADGNSDGDWEIYGACTQPAVYQYQSTGVSWNSNSFCASAGPLATGDAQGDGTPKIYVAGNSATGQGIMQYNFGSPAWQGNTVDSNAGSVVCLLCGDADNDQADELYAANSEQRIIQYKYNGTSWNKNILMVLGNGAINGMVLGDLEHAGKNKLYVANQDKNVYQLAWDGANWLSQSIKVMPGAGQAITIGDGDTDGNDEIYLACDNGHVYQLRLNAGNWQQQDLGNAGVPLNALTVGDGDNDYRLEIYAVGNNGHVYQFKAASAAPTPIPGTPTQTPIPDADKALKVLHSQINPARGEQARVRWYQADNASVTLIVYNLLGDKVATLAENRAFAPGQLQEVTWNGKTSRGALAGSGIYIVYLQTGNTKSRAKVAVIK